MINDLELTPSKKYRLFKARKYDRLWVHAPLVSFTLTKYTKSGVYFYLDTPALVNFDPYDIGHIIVPSYSPKYQIVLIRDFIEYQIDDYPYNYQIIKPITEDNEVLILTRPNTKVYVKFSFTEHIYSEGKTIFVDDEKKCTCKENDDCVCY